MASNLVSEVCRQSYASIMAGKVAMRTVGHDDELTQRGANPRTGLVTPFVTTDGSKASTGQDYVAAKPPHAKRRHRSHGRWKQDDTGWSFTDSALPSPIVQSAENSYCAASIKGLQDKFVVDMPGVDNPEPPQMSIKQIREYQESIQGSYGRGGRDREVRAATDPTTDLPQSIKRKEIGTGANFGRDTPTICLSRANDKKGLHAHIFNENNQQSSTAPCPPLRLSQYLPKIDLLHPSHFANLPSSYRRPSDLLPGRNRRPNTKPDISVAVDAMPPRPQVQRQDGAMIVPRVRWDTREGEKGSKIHQPHPSKVTPPADTSGEKSATELEVVREKLRQSQICKCFRCLDAHAVSRAPTPILRATSGNAARDPGLNTKNCHRDDEGVGAGDTKEMGAGNISKIPSTLDQPGLKSPNELSTGRTGDLTRSKSFVKRVERVTELLDLASLPDLKWLRGRMVDAAQEVILTFCYTPSALRILREGNVFSEVGVEALKTVLLAVLYFLVLLKIAITLVRVVRLILSILVVISWPAKIVATVVRWCLLG